MFKSINISKKNWHKENSGFTITELLVVIFILGILMAILLPSLGTIADRSRQKASLAEIQEIIMAINLYEQEYRDYPPTDLTGLGLPRHNQINSGIESVVVCLSGHQINDMPYISLQDRKLINTDKDVSSIPLQQLTRSKLPRNDLWEISDPWSSPYIYFHGRDIAKSTQTKYNLADENVWVTPYLKESKTGQIVGKGSFQLFSCGSDFVPNNEDDVMMK